MRALCIGSAACLDEDLAAAAALGVSEANGWTVIACNQAAVHYRGHVSHWASLHPDEFPKWVSKRHELGLPAAESLWTGDRRAIPRGLAVARAPNWAGSSGLLTVSVAVHLGATSAVLAGVPLDYRQGHFNKAAPWADGANYRKGWVDHVADMINVRSMSGWTRELLGAPDAAWLDGADLDASPNAYQGAIP